MVDGAGGWERTHSLSYLSVKFITPAIVACHIAVGCLPAVLHAVWFMSFAGFGTLLWLADLWPLDKSSQKPNAG